MAHTLHSKLKEPDADEGKRGPKPQDLIRLYDIILQVGVASLRLSERRQRAAPTVYLKNDRGRLSFTRVAAEASRLFDSAPHPPAVSTLCVFDKLRRCQEATKSCCEHFHSNFTAKC